MDHNTSRVNKVNNWTERTGTRTTQVHVWPCTIINHRKKWHVPFKKSRKYVSWWEGELPVEGTGVCTQKDDVIVRLSHLREDKQMMKWDMVFVFDRSEARKHSWCTRGSKRRSSICLPRWVWNFWTKLNLKSTLLTLSFSLHVYIYIYTCLHLITIW